MLAYRTFRPEETKRLGEAVGRLLGPGDVVGLIGELGAGKTVFAQGVAAGMGARGRVASPTFTIVHEHPARVPLYHIDVYRLEGDSELETIGLDEYLYGKGVVVLEWADRVSALLPDERLDVAIGRPGEEPDEVAGAGDDGREIVLIPHGLRFQHMVEELKALARPWD